MKNWILGISLLMVFSKCDDPEVDGLFIRIENSSNVDFSNVFVDTSGGSNNYGEIKSGKKSEYKDFELAYSYAYIQLTASEMTFTLQPIDYVGETPLENGEYTYKLTIEDFDSEYGMSLELMTD